MRTAVTLAKTHSGSWVMLANPDVPLSEHNKIYRGFLLEKAHKDYCYVQLQESDGLFRRVHLRTPDDHKQHVANLEKQNEEARIAGEAELKSREKVARDTANERAKQHADEIDRLNALAEQCNTKPAKPATPQAQEQPNVTALKPGGPTMEDWVDAGYNPAGYPPEGFSEVESAALLEYKETGKVTPRVAQPAQSISTPQVTESPSAPAAKPEGENIEAAS